jgi:hypothetical protein
MTAGCNHPENEAPDLRSTRSYSSKRDRIQRMLTVRTRIIESRPLKHLRSRAVF